MPSSSTPLTVVTILVMLDVGLVMIVVKPVVSDAGCGDSDVSSEVLVVLFVEVNLFMGLVMII